MKRSAKFLLAAVIALLLTATLGFYAFGADPEPQAESGYAFEVYDPSKAESSRVTKYTNPAQLTSIYLNSSISTTRYNNVIITLLDDIVLDSYIYLGNVNNSSYNASNQYNPANKADDINVYIDLNGYDLIFKFKENRGYTFFEVGSNVNVHIYSSRPDGKLINTYNNGTKIGSYALFNLRAVGASVIIGEYAPAAVRNTDGTYKTANTTCSGDNLSTYSSELVTTWSAYPAGWEYMHCIDMTVDITGGTHYRIAKERSALVMLENNATIKAKNATFVSNGTGNIFTAPDSEKMNAGNIASFENCTFYGDNLIQQSGSKTNITFNKCYIACNSLVESSPNDPTFANCTFGAGLLPAGGNIVKTNESKTISLNPLVFNYSGTDLAATPYTENKHNKVLYFTSTTAAVNNTVTITWINLDGEVHSEEWVKSEKITPIPYFIAPQQSGLCRYTYTPKFEVTSTGNKTYTLIRVADVPLKVNLTLYTDFVYNIYIPKSIVDTGLINSVKLADNASVDPATLEITNLNGTDYHTVKNEISAVNGDQTFTFTVNTNDASGTAFDTVYNFSIPDYIDKVLDGEYSDMSKNMVRATSTYIKAARNYYAAGSTPYPEASNPDLASLAHISGTKLATPSAEISDIFYSMTLTLEGQIRFRFRIKNTTTAEQRNMIFTYKVNATETVDKVTGTDWKDLGDGTLYYETVMKARDLRGTVKITLGTEEKATPDFTYSLANYAYFANDTSVTIANRELLTKLVDALWNYSLIADKYVHGTGTADVDMIVGNSIVTADTHVIVAGDAELTYAEEIRDAIYEKTGELLTIVNAPAQDKHNIIVAVDTPVVEYDLRASVVDNDLYITCGYKSFIAAGIKTFINKYISYQNSDINFANGFVSDFYTDKIYYSDFGAIGNGEASSDVDFAAIYQAHYIANNSRRHTVYADRDAVYHITDARINGTVTTVPIKTNVNWGNAKFIIDDKGLSPWNAGDSDIYSKNIFDVQSDYSKFTITDPSILNSVVIRPGTKRIALGLNYAALIMPYDSDHKVYRRKGYDSAWMGSDMHEAIIIDEYGYVSEDSPIMFNYTTPDKIVVYRLDLNPITIDGGVFESRASKENTVRVVNGANQIKENYFARGIKVTRANTTIKNLEHQITNEITLSEQASGILGNIYNGFFNAAQTYNVTYENCIMQGRRCFNRSQIDGIPAGAMGTYDISGEEVVNLTYKNCIQSNFWVDDTTGLGVAQGTDGAIFSMSPSSVTSSDVCWGIGGSNFCKNLVFDGSVLSRIDAHQGVYNGKVINSTVNEISLIGAGDFLIEGSTWYATGTGGHRNSIINLRSDYGSTWDGTITIKDTKAYGYSTEDKFGIIPTGKYTSSTTIVYHYYQNWYFGYDCVFPNIHINNLDFYNVSDGSAFKKNTKITVVTAFQDNGMHLDNTSNTSPYYADVDTNGDGKVDGTNIAFDGTTSTSGVQDTSTKTNLNKVVPPKFFFIEGNDGVDGSGEYKYQWPEDTTFFDNTKKDGIIIEDEVIPPEINNQDTPLVGLN